MRVVVTGASGNVGTSLLRALGAADEVDEIVGVARRRPSGAFAKTEWRTADVELDDLTPIFRGADCVVHLAWAIQPSHELAALRRTNVMGSERVFRAVADAGVPALVHASSVGAYSPGPKERPVDESWPTDGTPTSFYARHKAEVERLLDRFQLEQAETRVARLRPGLIFKRSSAEEQRRYFLGPFFPRSLARLGARAVVPDIDGLRVQAVHTSDVAEAYRLAVVGDARGAFNVAADPVLDARTLARALGAAGRGEGGDGCDLARTAAADTAGLARHGPRRADHGYDPGARGAGVGAAPQLSRGDPGRPLRHGRRRG
jgi:nucleoside-diphosphate-sugar epimerase